MRKQLLLLFLLSLTSFVTAGALCGLLIHLILTPVWTMGAIYAGLFFLTLSCFVLSTVFVVGMRGSPEDED